MNEPSVRYAGAAAWRAPGGGYVACVHCVGRDPDWLEDEDPKARGWSPLDDRTAGGRECAHCGRALPTLATVHLLPDGWSSVRAASELGTGRGPGGDVVKTERAAEVLVRDSAHVRVSLWRGPEVLVVARRDGAVEVRVWDAHEDEGGGDRWLHEAP